jgi:protein-tyrosine-phosphatase
MAERGEDIGPHVSRPLEGDQITAAGLVLGLAREHVREVCVLDREAWSRTFTLKELVRRAEASGPRPPGRDVDGWLDDLVAERSPTDLLGDDLDDDVADPIGLSDDDYRACAAEIDALVARLVDLTWPDLSRRGAA